VIEPFSVAEMQWLTRVGVTNNGSPAGYMGYGCQYRPENTFSHGTGLCPA
jgi:hypothetical protein